MQQNENVPLNTSAAAAKAGSYTGYADVYDFGITTSAAMV